jgi:3-keto-disaccharide hydrolase
MRLSSSGLLAILVLAPSALSAQGNPNPVPADPSPWPQHSTERPRPPMVTPGAFVSTPPPSDAIVLMDGRSLAAWRATDSAQGPARWSLQDGYMEVAPGTGAIATRQSFGDVQLHIEWKAPVPVVGESQHRGNSGVFFMGTYEVQILDTYQNDTYADGMAGGFYGQFPPLVNPIRRPTEWNSYDIVFHRPHFDTTGKVTAPARMTVFFNGVLVQDDQALVGPTSHGRRAPYEAHADKLPIELQDHDYKVRFRNMWVRNLE